MISAAGDENRHYLRAFIQTYRDLPVLWDTSLREYSNREKRAEAYEQLVPIYRYLKRDASVEDVKKKINTLRTNYRKELKVVESARRAGTVHHPRCWTFHELNFLRNAEKFLSVTPSARDSAFAFSDNSSLKMQQHNSSAFLDTNYSFRSIIGNNGAGQSPPNVTEMFQKSFGQQPQKLEPQQTPPPGGGGATNDFGAHATHSHDDNKRQRLSSLGSIANGGIKMQNPEELIGIACEYLSTTFPEEESIVRTWTHKLKRMNRDQRLLAEKFINDILFEGESGNLSRGSVQINAFEPFVRFEEQSHNAGSSSDELVKSQSPSVHTSTAEPKSLNINGAEGGSTAAPTVNAAPDSFPNFN